jgi:uncharacterized protein
MKFTADRPGGSYVIRAYAPGRLRIGEREITTSVIVSPATLIEPWRPRRMSEFAADDLEPAIALSPEVLLVGTGARQVFPDAAIFAALHAARIGFEIMDTGAACRTYNVLLAEDRRVAAALMIE